MFHRREVLVFHRNSPPERAGYGRTVVRLVHARPALIAAVTGRSQPSCLNTMRQHVVTAISGGAFPGELIAYRLPE